MKNFLIICICVLIAGILIGCTNKDKNIELINNLKELGINMEYKGEKTLNNQLISNKKFVITGTISFMSRDEIKALLEKYDGTTWVKLGKFTTDVNGKSLIGEKGHNGGTIMLMNHLYRLKEIEAPNGYRIDDSYAYIYNYNELFDNEYYPADFDLDSVKKLENNNIYVTDEKMEVNPNTSDVIKALLPFIIFLSAKDSITDLSL